jgi:hypothetical protein
MGAGMLQVLNCAVGGREGAGENLVLDMAVLSNAEAPLPSVLSSSTKDSD